MRHVFAFCRALTVLTIVLFASCSDRDPSVPGQLPVRTPPKPAVSQKAEITQRGPVGLYYMQKYWLATRHLEKAAWYFAPDGKVYAQVATGLGKDELAAHQGPSGTYTFAGNDELKIVWSDGQTQQGAIERDKANPAAFAWDTGLYAPVQPITDSKLLVGKFEGGTSASFAGGSTIAVKSLELRADGAFKVEGIATVATESEETVAKVGGESQDTGTWTASDYALTLKYADGRTVTGIAFPLFADDKEADIDRLYFQGFVYKRQ